MTNSLKAIGVVCWVPTRHGNHCVKCKTQEKDDLAQRQPEFCGSEILNTDDIDRAAPSALGNPHQL